MKTIKVLVIDDSMLFRKLLMERLSTLKNIEVIGYAIDAIDAEAKILKLSPDVVTLDIEMPGVSGMDFLKKFLPKHYVPVVIVSSLSISVFEALSTGAVDFVRKPDTQSGNSVDNFIRDLSTKIYIGSMAKAPKTAPKQTAVPSTGIGAISPMAVAIKNSPLVNGTIIAIGASTGGTEATLEVLKDLPTNTPGILVVQHMPVGFTDMYAQRLNKICAMEVKEAKDGDKVQKGRVLIAAGDKHMKIVKIGAEYSVKCFESEKVSGHRPSVDVLFHSMAEVVGANAVGIIMTGMGRDGADGLLAMRKRGAYTIGQDKESCVVYGMPMVAYNIGAVQVQTPCDNIANTLKKYLNSR